MSDKEIDVRVTANTADLKRGMSEAPGAVEAATSRIRGAFRTMQEETRNTLHGLRNDISAQVSGMAGPFSGLVDVLGTVKGGFIAVAAAAAMIGFSKSVNEAAEMTESAMDLSRALGITTNEASILQAALNDVGASPAEFEAAAKGLSRQLRSNEDDMRALGLATRDANGNLRPMSDLMLDGIQILNQYREGADRAIAAQTLFGRGVDTSSKLLLLNRDTLNENRAAVEELGLMVGENAVEAWKEYDSATDRAGLSVKGMVKAVGQSLMPVLTDLIKLFNSVMPTAIVVVKGALSGLTAAFLAVKNGVVVLWETINALVVTVAEPIRALAEAIWRAANGDFKGAGEAIKGIGGNVAGAWERAMQRIAESSAKTSSQIKGLFVPDSAAGRGGVSGDGTAAEDSKDSKTGKTAKSQGPIDVFDNRSFITSQKAVADFIRKQYDAVNDLQREIAREAERAAKETEDALKRQAEIEKKKIDAQTDFINGIEEEAVLSGMSNDERETALMLIEAEKLGIKDVNHLLELQAQIRENSNAKQAAEELKRQQDAIYESVQEGVQRAFADGLNAVASGDGGIRGALKGIVDTIRNALSNAIAGSLADQFLEMLGGKQGVLSIAGSLGLGGKRGDSASNPVYTKESGLSASSANTENTNSLFSGVVDTIKSMFEKIAIAIKAVFSSIGGAASGSGLGGIVGFFGSLFGGSIPSAASGYDVPAGINPITKLHEREMVLPAKHADVVRSMADSRGGAAQPVLNNNIVNVLDPRDAAAAMGSTREFESAVLNVIRLNPGMVQGAY